MTTRFASSSIARCFVDRLARHVEALAQFAERLTVLRVQPVEQKPAVRIRQSTKNRVVVHEPDYATIWLHVKRVLLTTAVSFHRSSGTAPAGNVSA